MYSIYSEVSEECCLHLHGTDVGFGGSFYRLEGGALSSEASECIPYAVQ